MASLPELRPPVARALAPIVGGIAFFVVLGLITWGLAVYLSSGNAQTTQNLAPQQLELGSVTSRATNVAEDGPLLIAELATITGTRSLVVDHEGDDPTSGWRLYYAFPPERPDCPVEQVQGTRAFIDCDGNELDVTELSPPTDPVFPVVDNDRTLYLDLTAFSTTPDDEQQSTTTSP